jgi:hypothetical protein
VLGWGELVGYRRVWLPEEVVDFGDGRSSEGCAVTTCPTCGSTWDDESHEFWLMVRGQGYFPGHCPICNGSLPEWEPAARSEEEAAAPGSPAASSPFSRLDVRE